MADYKKALRQGFEAAKKADLARKEIKEVLDTFKEQVLASSDGRLLIEVREFEEERDIFEVMKVGGALGRPRARKFTGPWLPLILR